LYFSLARLTLSLMHGTVYTGRSYTAPLTAEQLTNTVKIYTSICALLVRVQAPTGRTVRLELSNLFPSDPHALFEGGGGGGDGGILKISNCTYCLFRSA
jgi:hypothetical protein